MIKLNLAPNTPEWLEARAQYRTASELPIVKGLSPFTSREKFKLIKAGLAKQYYSKAMQQGHETEEATRQWANAHFKRDFQEAVWTNGAYLASLDGHADDTIIEIKCSSHTYTKIKEGSVPEYYVEQIHQQLYCSGAKEAYLVAFCPKTDQFIASDPIYPDPNFKAKADAAWESFEQLPLPEGPIDASDNLDLERAFRKYAQLKANIEAIEGELADVRQKILEFKAPDRNVQCRGFEIGFKKGAKRVDYRAAVPKGVDLTPFTTYGEPTWTLKMAAPEFEADDDES